MGLLSAAMNPQVLPQPQSGGRPPLTPQMPPQGQGMMGAWNGNPQFQQYLQSIMQGQGPGMQMPQHMTPQMPMGGAPMQQQRGGFGAPGGAPLMQPRLF